jgi:hypothetical protein
MTNPVEVEHNETINQLAETLRTKFKEDIENDNWQPLAKHFVELIHYYTEEAVGKTLDQLKAMQEEKKGKIIT